MNIKNNTMNNNDLDNIKGRDNLYQLARDNAISGYRKYKHVEEIREYIKYSLLQQESLLDRLDNTYRLRDLKSLAKELNISGYSKCNTKELKFKMRSKLDQLPFAKVDSGDNDLAPIHALSNVEYNKNRNYSFLNDPIDGYFGDEIDTNHTNRRVVT